jgi:hypothetical protein
LVFNVLGRTVDDVNQPTPEPEPRVYRRDNPDKVALDERERAARILRGAGWSIRRIARLLDVSPATIARLTGPTTPLVRLGEVVIDSSKVGEPIDPSTLANVDPRGMAQ